MQETSVITSIIENIRSAYEQQFTGFCKVTSHTDAQWYVYFLLGRVTWAQPSKHAFRAWQRHISLHSPALSKQIGKPVSLYYEYWNYAALSRLVKLKQFPRTQFSKIVEGYVAEVIFDILQAGEWQSEEFGELRFGMQEKDAGSMPFLMLENLQSWQKAEQSWQQWKKAGLKEVSPGWAPIIKDAPALKEQTPLQTFQTLSGFANGENTLRDLAIKVKQPIIPIARSIRPYVSRQLLDFTELSDIVENAHHGFSLELISTQQSSEQTDAAAVKQAASKVDDATTIQEKNTDADVTSQAVESVNVKPVNAESINDELATPVEELFVGAEKNNAVNEENVSKDPVEPTSVEPTSIEKISTEKSSESQASKSQELEEQTAKEQTTEEKVPEKQDAAKKNSKLEESSARQIAGVKTTIQSPDGSNLTTNIVQVNQDKKRQKRSRRSKLPKIVYVDDSPADSRTMAAIVESAGYEYINIPDPLQAIPMLIELRPKLIFLDLVMPIANGYEVCAQIRRVTAFKKTPVIIVTSNDGIADRVRAKIVGASGFMGKPIKEKRVLKVFKKHLAHVKASP